MANIERKLGHVEQIGICRYVTLDLSKCIHVVSRIWAHRLLVFMHKTLVSGGKWSHVHLCHLP